MPCSTPALFRRPSRRSPHPPRRLRCSRHPNPHRSQHSLLACVPIRVANGGFEAGGTGWQQRSSQGFILICNARNCGVALTPHSGNNLAWLGGANSETSQIVQTINVPANQPASLSYWYRINSADSCSYDFATVQVSTGGKTTTVRKLSLCAPNNTAAWVNDHIDLSAFGGKKISLSFTATTDSWLASSLFVDDVKLSSGQSCAVAAAASAPVGAVDGVENATPPARATDEPEVQAEFQRP